MAGWSTACFCCFLISLVEWLFVGGSGGLVASLAVWFVGWFIRWSAKLVARVGWLIGWLVRMALGSDG